MNSMDFRTSGRRLCALATCLIATSAAAQETGGPDYTYIGVGYEWTDIRYALGNATSSHEGFFVEGSLGITDWLHVYGEFFDGDFDSDDPNTEDDFQPSAGDSTGFHVGLGVSYSYTPNWDVMLRVAYVDSEIEDLAITQFPPPGLGVIDIEADGYQVEALVRGKISDRTELNMGYTYTDTSLEQSGGSLALDDSVNRDWTIGMAFEAASFLTLTASAQIFDSDTGFALGVRSSFGNSIF